MNKEILLGYASNDDSTYLNPVNHISLTVTPKTLRCLANFLNLSADLMEKEVNTINNASSEWHQHFRDYYEDWNEDDMIDVVIHSK